MWTGPPETGIIRHKMNAPAVGPPRWSPTRLRIRGVIRLAIALLFIGVPLFWGAGTLDWPRGRLFLGMVGATLLVNLTVLLVWRPGLMQERWRRRKDTKPFDKVFGILYLLSVLALFKYAGMDAVRYRWTSMPEWTLYVGVALHVLGCCPVLWALLANPYLETTVRIQKDRGHRVISDGPYRYARHPMYAGMIPMFLGWPLVLGSYVALGVAGFIAALLLVRTVLEDRTLQQELPGYTAYCETTRYRLVPGLW
jgi:protein-S-isoprenylcysteine O-methyltransferase Ste14